MKALKDAHGRDDFAVLFTVGAVGRLSDGELLARFLDRDDAFRSDSAFEALVTRHGAMVMGVCRRTLADEHAAADAFQAVFLVLARRAAAVRVDGSLAPWLHGVAVKVARRARATIQAERARTRSIEGVDPPDRSVAIDPREHADLSLAIDQEIARLPARYQKVVVLCDLEGRTGEQAARILDCPLGTLRSRLHRARARLRSGLARRGLAPEAWETGTLGLPLMRTVAPARLVTATVSAAGRLAAGESMAAAASATVAGLVNETLKEIVMTQGLWIKMFVAGASFSMTTAVALTAPAPRNDPPPVQVTDPPKVAEKTPVKKSEPSIADQFARIRAEYDAQIDKMTKAVEKLEKQSEYNDVYARMAPDDVAFCRRMVELALTKPSDKGARDALLWVLDHPNRGDSGEYGDEFARAAALLVRHHGDDPEAVRIGLGLDNVCSMHRDLLLSGFLASTKSKESRGIARLALAKYLVAKANVVESARKHPERVKIHFQTLSDDGKLGDKAVDESDEDYAYRIILAQSDQTLTREAAIRLFQEVVAEYGDVPYVTIRVRALEALLKDPNATVRGKPLCADDRRRGERMLLAEKKTLGDVATAALDDLTNLKEGMPAPEIAGVSMDGKPLKLSDYRGKVVILVFWGTWCGPCMAQVPHEREMAERLKNKPFAILGVDCDGDQDEARKVIAREKITWPQWSDGDPGVGPIAKRYHIKGYPTVVVIDAKGMIRFKDFAGTWVDELIDKLVTEAEQAKR